MIQILEAVVAGQSEMEQRMYDIKQSLAKVAKNIENQLERPRAGSLALRAETSKLKIQFTEQE